MELDREEREILVDLLETRLADLRMEIGRTSRLAYRDMLRQKKKVLEKMVAYFRGDHHHNMEVEGIGRPPQ